MLDNSLIENLHEKISKATTSLREFIKEFNLEIKSPLNEKFISNFKASYYAVNSKFLKEFKEKVNFDNLNEKNNQSFSLFESHINYNEIKSNINLNDFPISASIIPEIIDPKINQICYFKDFILISKDLFQQLKVLQSNESIYRNESIIKNDYKDIRFDVLISQTILMRKGNFLYIGNPIENNIIEIKYIIRYENDPSKKSIISDEIHSILDEKYFENYLRKRGFSKHGDECQILYDENKNEVGIIIDINKLFIKNSIVLFPKDQNNNKNIIIDDEIDFNQINNISNDSIIARKLDEEERRKFEEDKRKEELRKNKILNQIKDDEKYAKQVQENEKAEIERLEKLKKENLIRKKEQEKRDEDIARKMQQDIDGENERKENLIEKEEQEKRDREFAEKLVMESLIKFQNEENKNNNQNNEINNGNQ